MNKLILIILALSCASTVFGQNRLKIKIINAENKEPLAGATVSIQSQQQVVTADSTGVAVFQNLLPGKYAVTVTYTGYAETGTMVTIPFAGEFFEIVMEPEDKEEEEVIIQSTR